MSRFSVSPELKVGSVVEVAGESIRIEIDSSLTELTRTHAGDVYPVGQCGSILKLHCGRKLLFAYVKVLRMRSEIAFEEGVPAPPPGEDARMIEATLIAEGRWSQAESSLKLERGVASYPLPGQAAYLTTLAELSSLYGSADDSGVKYKIPLGTYVGANNAVCYANLDKLVGLHTAILGSTGAGKSGTVSAVLRGMLECKTQHDNGSTLRPRIVLIDPHGEYANAFKDRCVVYQAYSAAAEDSALGEALPLRLPYWLMSGEEFRDLVIGKTEFEATSENNIVLKALRHSRLVARGLIEPAKDDWEKKPVEDGVSPEADRPLHTGNQEELDFIASYDRDTPDTFLLSEFRRYIESEVVMRVKSGKWESRSPSERTSHDSILDKLSVLERDPRLSFIMSEEVATSVTLDEVIEQFVGDLKESTNKDQADIRIIDISGLPNEVAGPLTAAIARVLFQYKVWQTREERQRDPVLLVCEEAHRYVPDTGLAEYASAQKAVRRLAKEGRKYGIGMMLVSQRPADVEGTVLSQCNSWIVLRLTNSADQQHVRRFLPDNLAGLAALLPSLSRQDAIFVGDAASLPARVRIRTLESGQLPDSNDMPYGDGWSQPPVTRDDIAKVTSRWRKETPQAEAPTGEEPAPTEPKQAEAQAPKRARRKGTS